MKHDEFCNDLKPAAVPTLKPRYQHGIMHSRLIACRNRRAFGESGGHRSALLPRIAFGAMVSNLGLAELLDIRSFPPANIDTPKRWQQGHGPLFLKLSTRSDAMYLRFLLVARDVCDDMHLLCESLIPP
jgi:transposase InsO family protein